MMDRRRKLKERFRPEYSRSNKEIQKTCIAEKSSYGYSPINNNAVKL